MKNLKNKRGITLISLVITVIVILIVAIVAISLLTGEENIYSAANDASEKYKTEAQNEQDAVLGLSTKTSLYLKGDSLVQEILSIIYPVGSIYISTSSTNPGELFGGTWEAYGQGRTLIGVGTGTDENSTEREFTANETGGEYTHRLTVEEMPSHSHSYWLRATARH